MEVDGGRLLRSSSLPPLPVPVPIRRQMAEVEQTAIGAEATQRLPGDIVDKCYRKQLSRSYNDDEPKTRMSKKQKQSTSRGEVASSTDLAAIPSLKLERDDSLEPNMATQRQSAITGQRDQPATGWTILKMMIPIWCDNSIKFFTAKTDENKMRSVIEGEAELYIEDAAGVKVVIVSAKDDLHSPTSPAVANFVNIHKNFVDSLSFESGFWITRLLVRVELVKGAFWSSTFKGILEEEEDQRENQCDLLVYLTDDASVLSDGYALIELLANPEHCIKAVKDIADLLRCTEIMNYESGSPPLCDVLELQQSITFKRCHTVPIPSSYVDYIIGENGANIKKILQKGRVSIMIRGGVSDKVYMDIKGANDSDILDAEEDMKIFLPKGCSVFSKDKCHDLFSDLDIVENGSVGCFDDEYD